LSIWLLAVVAGVVINPLAVAAQVDIEQEQVYL
jgi:hypothetical protein